MIKPTEILTAFGLFVVLLLLYISPAEADEHAYYVGAATYYEGEGIAKQSDLVGVETCADDAYLGLCYSAFYYTNYFQKDSVTTGIHKRLAINDHLQIGGVTFAATGYGPEVVAAGGVEAIVHREWYGVWVMYAPDVGIVPAFATVSFRLVLDGI